MAKRLTWTTPLIAAAGALALLLGLGLGLILFHGPETSAPTGDAIPSPTCTGEKPTMMLDDSKVPEAGSALETTLKNAVMAYFTCQSLPIERFSRVFATLSVVIADYVPDPACLGNDQESLSTRWPEQKALAERQGRADLLAASLRTKIGRTVACLPADQQRRLYVDIAHAFSYAAGAHALQSFVNPTFKGERVDHCLNYARDCDEPAAQAWCARYGYRRITKWEWMNVPRTVTLGDKRACEGSCGAFTTIECAQ